jgi:dephospho-CoA kinase
VLVVGLTGGIGSGKSTVASLLAGQYGAVVLDADAIVREVQAPGGLAYDGIVARFGPDVVLTDGSLDRAALAAVVFADSEARADLGRLTHPFVGQVMAERMAALASTDAVVVLDIPLLAERGRSAYPVAGVIVVDCPIEVAVERLVRSRGFSEADARARVAAQITREERRAIADVVIDNSGPLEDLAPQVDTAWSWIQDLHPTPSGEAVTPG